MENKDNKDICKECGHHRIYHLKGICVHGLRVTEHEVNYTDSCSCKEFQENTKNELGGKR